LVSGFQFRFPTRQSPHEILKNLQDSYTISLSLRKLKHLQEHGWIGSRWGVIPWGFFSPNIHMSEVLYEDDHVLSVYKPPFVTVVGPKGRPSLLSFWKKRYPKISAVHRLDFETSGVVVFTKTAKAYQEMLRSFRERGVQKKYLLVMKGKPTRKGWDVNIPLQRYGNKVVEGSKFLKRSSSQIKSAKTKFSFQKSFKGKDGKAFSVLEACPLTGRRHQIRFHIYKSGYSVVGETLYGGMDPMRARGSRLMLHAQSLSVSLFEKVVRVSCPAPPDFIC